MTEERWHNFAKEKPSEDMEGRNFIVSNGHYEKIATWCGYWENEPFMGDHLCDEVVRWKFYFTPEDVQASHYAEMVDAGMRERRLRRALWLARALRAEAQWNRQLRDAGIAFAIGENKSWDFWNQKQKKWQGVERKCLKKAEEYK